MGHHFPPAECSEMCRSCPGQLLRELTLFQVCIDTVRKLARKEHYRSDAMREAAVLVLALQRLK